MCNMASRNHADNFAHGRMIGKCEEGRSVTHVAQEFVMDKSVTSSAWRKAFHAKGIAVRKVGSGEPRQTVPMDDQYLAGKNRLIRVSGQHCSADGNGMTSVMVYYGQKTHQLS